MLFSPQLRRFPQLAKNSIRLVSCGLKPERGREERAFRQNWSRALARIFADASFPHLVKSRLTRSIPHANFQPAGMTIKAQKA